MSRFAVLSSLPENATSVPLAPKLSAIGKSILGSFCPGVHAHLFSCGPEVRALALALVCKFYGLDNDQYDIEAVHFEVTPIDSYDSISSDEVLNDMNFPSLTAATSLNSRKTTSVNTLKSSKALQIFNACTESSVETVNDRNLRMSIEFKAFLREFWMRCLGANEEDGEFDLRAYLFGLSLLHTEFPELPFHFKANAFIDVIGPRVYCHESQVFFVPHIGSTEYMDACQSIHFGNIEVIDAGFDSDIVANDVYAGSITCFDY